MSILNTGDIIAQKGLLKQKIELHNGIITASRNGSNPAQEQVRLMLQKLESELKHG